jgi:hypothetical protein
MHGGNPFIEETFMTRSDVAGDVLKGAIAGLTAAWLMNRATTWMYELEGEQAREREERARGGTIAYATAAASAASTAGIELSPSQQQRAGTALHWAMGAAAGAAYAMARSRWPAIGRGGGLPFGLGFFLAVDEVMNPVLGFTPGPRAFPWQTHARGLGGHLVFGAATEGMLQGLNRLPRLRRDGRSLVDVECVIVTTSPPVL